MKNHCSLFLFMLLVQRSTQEWEKFWVFDLNTAEDERQMYRLAQLMRGYVERTEVRWREILPIKTKLTEINPDRIRAFEKGYVMADIVETYRKAVVFTHKQMVKQRYIESERIRYLMYVQNAYVKVYHLTHMMHEIDPKYGTDNTGQINQYNLNVVSHDSTPSHYNTTGFYYSKELDDIRQARVKERRKKVIEEKRLRQWELDRLGTVKPGTVKTTTNWWPVAYGWDIDYYW
ncbi:uncharacterized protein LOC133532649 [Cydia pomonella]|uniref:uncharacterized protein LOC133532649 n=1 Tax=Cydia pomonella TaxID=82600 RepID=UPI002ADE7D79|nr:uncharacterized protein LOC133532649 [Cydia pomonella]